MAPSLEKTWQVTPNQRVFSHGSGQHLADARQLMRQNVVEPMMNFSSGWLCMGSSKGVVGGAGMDNTYRWGADTDLIFASAGGVPHSWIVLYQPGLGAHLCADLVGHTNNSSAGSCVLFFISFVGFGAANGGTDGSHTTRPTAVDEIPISTSATGWLGNAVNSSVSRNYITHVEQSSDGECTRIIIRAPGSATYTAMGLFEKVKNPAENWANPVVARWQSSTNFAQIPALGQWNSNALLHGRAPAGPMTMYMSSPGWAGSPAAQQLQSKNAISQKFQTYGISVASETPGAEGIHGKLFDAYWVGTTHVDGSTSPPGGPREWTTMGDLLLPWTDVAQELV